MRIFLVMVLTSLLLGWMRGGAHGKQAQPCGDGWLFPPITAMKLLAGICVMMGLTFMLSGVLGVAGGNRIVAVVGIFFVFLGFLAFPHAIFSAPSGLRQRTMMGRLRALPWAGLTSVSDKPDGSVVVKGEGGAICLSPFHGGRDRFYEEIRRYRHDLVPPVTPPHPRRKSATRPTPDSVSIHRPSQPGAAKRRKATFTQPRVKRRQRREPGVGVPLAPRPLFV